MDTHLKGVRYDIHDVVVGESKRLKFNFCGIELKEYQLSMCIRDEESEIHVISGNDDVENGVYLVLDKEITKVIPGEYDYEISLTIADKTKTIYYGKISFVKTREE